MSKMFAYQYQYYVSSKVIITSSIKANHDQVHQITIIYKKINFWVLPKFLHLLILSSLRIFMHRNKFHGTYNKYKSCIGSLHKKRIDATVASPTGQRFFNVNLHVGSSSTIKYYANKERTVVLIIMHVYNLPSRLIAFLWH